MQFDWHKIIVNEWVDEIYFTCVINIIKRYIIIIWGWHFYDIRLVLHMSHIQWHFGCFFYGLDKVCKKWFCEFYLHTCVWYDFMVCKRFNHCTMYYFLFARLELLEDEESFKLVYTKFNWHANQCVNYQMHSFASIRTCFVLNINSFGVYNFFFVWINEHRIFRISN